MADILFSHSYFLSYDPKQWKTMKPYPPLGTIYAASFMRESGYEVALHDVMFRKDASEILEAIKTHSPKYLVFYDDGFNYLTKMCLTNMRHAVWKMAKLAQDQGIKVILSSSDSTDHHKDYLANGADVVIIGEAEQTLLELIQTFEKNEGIEAIEGIAYLKDNEVIKTPKRPVIKDLDTLPRPAWDLVDVEEYKSRWKSKHGYFSLNQVTTRGCPFKCNWCAKPIYGNRYNSRSPKSVVDELLFIKEKYNPDHLWFCDDIFGLKPNWVQEFADLCEKNDLKIPYMIQSRVDLLLHEDTAECMARSGCRTIWLGAESGSQKILDAMDKGTTVEQIREARQVLKKYGIRCAFFLQFGYLGEDRDDIQKTIDMVKDLMPDEIGVSVSYPLPGTKFYDIVKSDLGDKANWTDSDDLDLMFKNNFSSGYYKTLQRYIHKALQVKKGKIGLKKVFSAPGKLKKGEFRKATLLPYYSIQSWRFKKRLQNHG